MRQTPRVSKPDVEALKQKEVQFCATGYHSFKSVENNGFRSVLQACVYLGAKYGKFDVGEILAGRKAVSRETKNLATKTKDVIKSRLKESIEDSTVALSIDMYTDDFRKKAYLDVHATWVERDFKLHHAVLVFCAYFFVHRGQYLAVCMTGPGRVGSEFVWVGSGRVQKK